MMTFQRAVAPGRSSAEREEIPSMRKCIAIFLILSRQFARAKFALESQIVLSQGRAIVATVYNAILYWTFWSFYCSQFRERAILVEKRRCAFAGRRGLITTGPERFPDCRAWQAGGHL
jgi:hypothetical protein